MALAAAAVSVGCALMARSCCAGSASAALLGWEQRPAVNGWSNGASLSTHTASCSSAVDRRASASTLPPRARPTQAMQPLRPAVMSGAVNFTNRWLVSNKAEQAILESLTRDLVVRCRESVALCARGLTNACCGARCEVVAGDTDPRASGGPLESTSKVDYAVTGNGCPSSSRTGPPTSLARKPETPADTGARRVGGVW